MSQESAELKVLRAILDKLDKIERLQALGAVRGTAKEQDKIDLLDTLGFKGSEIDRLLGKSAGYSAVVLYQLKKKKQPKEDTSAKVETTTLPEVTAP